MPFDTYTDRVDEAYCDHAVTCGTASSVADCLVTQSKHNYPTQTLITEVHAGQVIYYDGEAAQACVDSIATASCVALAVPSTADTLACLNTFQGFRHGGDSCAINQECISQRCSADEASCQSACCLGTCDGYAPPRSAKLGESCEQQICDDTSYCDSATETCTAYKAENEPCGAGLCGSGLTCLHTHVCGRLPAEGEPCDAMLGCAQEKDYCNDVTHRCTAAGLAGAACNDVTRCSDRYFCDRTEHCVAGVAQGASCSPLDDHCVMGLFCDGLPGQEVCVPKRGTGEPCTSNVQCEFRCDTSAGTCYADQVCD